MKKVTVLSLAVASVLLAGYTLYLLWSWYLVPAFNIPVISIQQAIGLILIASLLGLVTKDAEGLEQDVDKLLELASSYFFQILIILFLGWLVHIIG